MSIKYLILLLLAAVAGVGGLLTRNDRTAEVPGSAAGFQAQNKPVATLSRGVFQQFFADRSLYDPGQALPAFARYSYQAVRKLRDLSRRCPAEQADALAGPSPDLALTKALAWHNLTCGSDVPAGQHIEDLIRKAPYLHPNGNSYAMLWHRRQQGKAQISGDDLRYFHALELRQLQSEGAAVFSDQRLEAAIKAIDPDILKGMLDSREEFISRDRVGLQLKNQDREVAGGATWGIYPRQDWERYLEGSGASAALSTRRKQIFRWSSLSLATLVLLVLASDLSRLIARKVSDQRERRFLLQLLTHELRTPVTSANVNFETLRPEFDRLSPAGQDAFLRLSKSLSRMRRNIELSTGFLAADTGKSNLNGLDPVTSLNQVTRSVINEFAATGSGDQSDLQPAFSPLKDDCSLRIPRHWYTLCLLNLLDNATKHGAPPVSVTLRRDAGRVTVAVRDSGSLPAGQAKTLFKPFAKNNRSDGLGLGLSLVAAIVRRTGGQIKVNAEPTCFELSWRTKK